MSTTATALAAHKPKLQLSARLRAALIAIACGIALMVVAATGIFVWTNASIDKKYDVQPVALAVKPDPSMVDRGRELATFRGCRDCHGDNLQGRVVEDAMPVMVLAGPNITPGGVTKDYTNQDWARAIRHGVKRDGRSVRFMPAYEYTQLSHDDLAAIIAYARSVPAVDQPARPFEVGPLGRVLYLAGELPLLPAEIIDHNAKPAAPTRGPTAEYGAYLASACVGCHGDELSGGPIPGAPPQWAPAANLTPHDSGLAEWTFEDFKKLFATGVRPDGTKVDGRYMPYEGLNASTSEEDLRALWEYTRIMPPKAAGGR